jgi:hypothetical protein
VPELKFREPSDERPEFIILLCGQSRLAVFESFILGQARIELGLQKGEEEVEQVDTQAVRDNVPTLGKYNAQEEKKE